MKQHIFDLQTRKLIAEECKTNTIRNIAKKYKCSKPTIDRIIREFGAYKDKKYNYNFSLFDEENEINTYLLGAFMTDGWVDPNYRRISLCSKDKEWLYEIGNILSNPGLEVKKRKSSNCYDIKVNNKQIVNWFLSKKCIRNKSLILEFPELKTKKNYSQFLRGVFDGDGSINISKYKHSKTKSLRIYIVSGSFKFANSLHNFINNELKINAKFITIKNKQQSIMGGPPKDYNDCYRVMMNNKYAIQFLDYIYKDKNLFLERKHKLYLDYLEQRKWELNNTKIRKQFESKEYAIELSKKYTVKEIAKIYGTTTKTIYDRFKKIGVHIYKQNHT